MKSISTYLVLFLFPILAANVQAQVDLPITFETGEPGNAWTWNVFENVDNPALELVANPDGSDINASATVAKFTARQAGAPYAGAETFDKDTFTLDATNSIVKIMVYKSVISDVGIKFAVGAAAQPEIKVANTVVDQWEELTFDFSGNIGLAETIGITTLIVFPDFADRASDTVSYFDNISFSAVGDGGGDGDGGSAGDISTDFEAAAESYVFSDFDGGAAAVIANPVSEGINASAQVGRMLKFNGAVWAGSKLVLDTPMDLASGTVFTMKVWSQRAVPVLFKLEPAAIEVSVNHGGSGWEELSFDFGDNTATGVTDIALIFDLGVAGDADADPANWTFYFDDIEQTTGGDSGGGDDGGGEAMPFETIEFETNSPAFTGFGGNDFAAISNPDASGINASPTVGSTMHGAETWAGIETLLADSLDFTEKNVMKMKVWSPTAGTVKFKIEAQSDAGINLDVDQTIAADQVNQWVELVFDFTGAATDAYDKMALFFDFGVSSAQTFYFDDIAQSTGGDGGDSGGSGGDISTDFEGVAGSYVFTDFDGGAAAIIDNPVSEGINTSAQVGRMLKFTGAVWAGSKLALEAPMDLASGTVFTMKVWSQRAVPVLFKLEPAAIEVSVNHGGSGWEELSFDFGSNTATGVTDIALIFDLGVAGDADADPANWTFYFDDIEQTTGDGGGGDSGGSGGDGAGTVSFETGEAGDSWSWSVFENVDNPALELVSNPDASDINTSAMVAKFTARQAGMPWAGTESFDKDTFTLDASNSIVKIMVYKSVISDVGIKFAVGAAAQPEIKVGNTVVDQWEELTFDFSGNIGLAETIGITTLTVFPDFDLDGRASETVSYFDNISFSAAGDGGDSGGGDSGGGSDLSTEFEGAAESYVFTDFDGGAAAIITNPVSEGINTSAQVGRMLKFNGAVWAGSKLALEAPMDLASGTVFTMKVWSQRAVPVLFKLEPAAIEVSVNHGGSGWEELSFDFGDNTATGVTDIALIFDLGVAGDADADPANWTFYFDDIEQTTGGGDGGGGGGGGDSQIDLPLTFDDVGVDYDLVDFGGTFSALAADPADGANLAVMTTKGNSAETWAGTSVADSGLSAPIAFSVSDTQISVRVYSPDTGIQVRLKAEDSADDTHTVETEAVTTVSNAWETLIFDFANEATETAVLNLGYVYDKLSIFFDFGTDGATAGEKVYYWDDIAFAGGSGDGGGGEAMPFETIEFETNSPTFTGFGGNDFAAIANPDASGINTSATVGSTTHGAETWAGIETLLVDSLDFTEKNAMKIKVWSPTAGTVKFKIEAQSDAGINLEVDQTIAADQVDQWVDLVFDFTGASVDAYDKMALFFDFGVSSALTFYFDDIEQVAIEGDSEPFVFETIDFETVSPTFVGFEGSTFATIANPDASGENTSVTVAETIHGSATFAGLTLDLGGKLDFSAAQALQLKVWSPKAGILVKLKLEDKLDSTINVEKNALTTTTNTWETLTFDFVGSPSDSYDRVILFLDFGSSDATTFYFDDLELTNDFETPDPIEFEPIDFEGGAVTFSSFGGNSFALSGNPDTSGINTSATVGKTIHGSEVWGGLSSDFLGKLDFSSKPMIQIKVWSPKAGVTVKLKLEAQADANVAVEKDLTTTVTNAWELLTFDFTGEPSDAYDRMAVFFDFGSSDETTFYFDEIAMTDGLIVPGPIDFEDDVSAIDAGDGTMVALVENPDRTGLNLSKNVAALENPGGVESTIIFGFGGMLDLESQSTVQLRVWSPKAGVTVRMTLGDSPAPSSANGDFVSLFASTAVSRDYVMTKTNEWEILTFDFEGEASGEFEQATVTFDVGSVEANTYHFDSLNFVDEGDDNPHLVNVSTRGMVLTGEQLLIVGFVIEGDSDKKMLIRGVGPTLSEFGLEGALSDPYLEIYDANKNLIMENDDWTNDDVAALNDTMDAAGAFPLLPDSKDAVIVGDFAPGLYTAHMYGVDGATGVGMIEAYEIEEDANRLVNVSTRGEVGVGEDILIAGFVVSSNSCKVLIRAAGAALQDYGIDGVLSDPVLKIFDSNGAMIAENDDWSLNDDAAQIALVGTALGAFDFVDSSSDSAVLLTLGAGVYTAQVSGTGSTTGVALVEVYEVAEGQE
jgi:hypothetical protein